MAMEVDAETAGLLRGLLSSQDALRAAKADEIWKRIMQDPELNRARGKLSMHELRIIIKHSLDVLEPGK
jgi:hypothetical protein